MEREIPTLASVKLTKNIRLASKHNMQKCNLKVEDIIFTSQVYVTVDLQCLSSREWDVYRKSLNVLRFSNLSLQRTCRI